VPILKEFRMVVDEIYRFIEPNADKVDIPELFKEFETELIHGVQRQLFQKRVYKPTLRLSGIGKCLRGQAYTVAGYPKKDINPRTKITFLMGDIVEALIVLLAKHAGVILTDEQLEVKLNGVVGHIDGIVEFGGKRYLFECKSMSSFSFDKFKREGMGNDFGYVSQANSYAYALGLDGIVWVGMNKNTGHLHEEVRAVDAALAEKTVEDINILRACKDPKELPQFSTVAETWYKKETGNQILPFQCSYCDHNEVCWDGVTKYERKGKIKHYAGKIIHGPATEGGRIIK
jgi:hypothetical protein